MNARYLVAATLCLAGCSAPAEMPPPTSQVVKWIATEGAVRPAPDGGYLMDVVLRAEVEPGWKLYSLTQGGGGPVPMSVKPRADAALNGFIQGPPVTRAQDPNFNIETETYSGTPEFQFAVKIPAVADSSKPVELDVRSQACSDKLCLPARTTKVSVVPKAG